MRARALAHSWELESPAGSRMEAWSEGRERAAGTPGEAWRKDPGALRCRRWSGNGGPAATGVFSPGQGRTAGWWAVREVGDASTDGTAAVPRTAMSVPPGASGARASSLAAQTAPQGYGPRTCHELHLLRDVVALLTVRSLCVPPGLPPTLGAGLEVRSQGAAATPVPTGTTCDLRPTVTAQSPANHLD